MFGLSSGSVRKAVVCASNSISRRRSMRFSASTVAVAIASECKFS